MQCALHSMGEIAKAAFGRLNAYSNVDLFSTSVQFKYEKVTSYFFFVFVSILVILKIENHT